MKKINTFRLALVTTGIAGFATNIVQTFYNLIDVDVILLAYLVALGVTIVIVAQSFNAELWKVGIYILSSFTVTLIVPMAFTILVEDISNMTKLITYLAWFAFPLIAMALGFTVKGDNKN